LSVYYDPVVSNRFPRLLVCSGVIDRIRVERENEQIQRLRRAVYEKVKAQYHIDTLKDDPTVRAYRDFYWKLGIDPTKTRPSGEALLRRVLNGNELPRISTVVDAYNLASMQTVVPISGFDRDCLSLPFKVRFAENLEQFVGIGMDKPMQLSEKMLVLTDQKQVLCIYPYRDSDCTKITMQTRNAVIVGYGAPGIGREKLKDAVETTLMYIKQVADGGIEAAEVFEA
jgi:DNA/RNA-binding domain of Phe-tRNA-synthetase-like protein